MLEQQINEWLRRFENGEVKVTVVRTPYGDIGGVTFLSADGERRWWTAKSRCWMTGYLGFPIVDEPGRYTIYVYIRPGVVDDPRPVATLQGVDVDFFWNDDDGSEIEDEASPYCWHELGPVEVIEAK